LLARRLFARARNQGGLKIHTIHGFCERLLRRPLESQVTPHFPSDEREGADAARGVDATAGAPRNGEGCWAAP
jgi:ATP-dependent helicase/nuclease subunit A